MNTVIKNMFETISTRKYIRNVNKKDIEIFINSDNKNETKVNEGKKRINIPKGI